MWNLNYDTKELIDKIERDRYRKQNLQLPKGKGTSRVKSGVWDQQILTIIYEVDKQQSPTEYHRKLYPTFCNNL